MRKTHLKGFLIALLGFMLLIIIISLIMPSKVVVSNTEMVNAPKERIMALVTQMEQWPNWHPSFSDSLIQYELNPSEKNRSITWHKDGKKYSVEMLEVNDEHIKFEMKQEGKNPIVNIISVTAMAEAGGNQISWDALTKLKWYPWEKFSGIFINDISGPGYRLALSNIKKIAEQQP